MSPSEDQKPWIELENLVAESNGDALHEYLDTLSSAEIARSISRLEEETQATLLTILEPEDAADLLEELPDAQGADIIEDLPAEQAAAIVDEMDSDHRVDLLGDMDESDAEAILAKMDPEEAQEARELLQYDPDTAGGIMVTEFVVYPHTLTVGDVLNDLRTNAEAYSDYGVQYAYVQSDTSTLIGVLRLRDLVLSLSSKPIRELMIVNPISVLDDAPLEELEQTFDRFMFSGLPVVSHQGKLVGVVMRSDAEVAQTERSDRTFMRFSGIIGGEELRTKPLGERTAQRLCWLVINLLLSLAAIVLIDRFKPTIESHLALAALLPVLANLCGCSGNQAIAVSIREMTLGLITSKDVFRVIRLEWFLGLINGIVVGVLLSFFMVLGGQLGIIDPVNSPIIFGVVVGLSFALNTVLAVALGGAIPLVLKRLDVDPAVAAAPIMTTIVDICGFFIILMLASHLLM